MSIETVFNDVGPLLSNQDLLQFEQEIGMILPDQYKTFLLRQNGGFPESSIGIPIEGKIIEILVFQSLTPSDDSGLRGVYRRMIIDRLYPLGYLPIAQPDSGASICINDARTGGAIFLSEYVYEDDNPVDVLLSPIADSFDAFCSRLIPIPQIYCPVIEMAKSGDAQALAEYLRGGGSIESESKDGNSLLCEAILHRNRAVIDACLKAGASLRGSVSAAIGSGIPEVLSQLIQAGADVEELDQFGRPPIRDLGGTALPGEEGVTNRKMEKLLLDAIRSKHQRK